MDGLQFKITNDVLENHSMVRKDAKVMNICFVLVEKVWKIMENQRITET